MRWPQPPPILKQHRFNTCIRARLQADLQHEPIAPGFFLNIMLSDTMKHVGMSLLIMGLLALGLLIGAIVNPAASIALTSLNLSEHALAMLAVGGSGLGTTVFTTRFFMHRHLVHQHKLTDEAVEHANNIPPQGSCLT